MADVKLRSRSNITQGFIFSPVLLALATLVMIPFRTSIGLVSVTAILLTAVTISGLISHFPVTLGISVASGFLLNYFFMAPYGSLKIHNTEDFVGFVSYSMISIISVFLISEWKKSLQKINTAVSLAHQETQRAARSERRLTWLNQISHDIRTPLSTIRAVLVDIHDDIQYDNTTREALLDVAVDEMDRLDFLVNNWILYGSMESRPPETAFNAVDINEVITDSCRRLSPLLRNHTVEVNCPPEIDQINGSFSEVQHLVLNLLTNAHQHTRPTSKIKISSGNNQDGVFFTVDDDGEGFGDRDFNDLLRPFVVGERSNSSGLGLSICAEVVRRHGGSIAAATSPQGGGRVIVKFPRRERHRLV